MTYSQACREYRTYPSGYCIVRWASRYGRPAWTIETIARAQLAESAYGPAEVRWRSFVGIQ